MSCVRKPDKDATSAELVEEAVEFRPVLYVELRETKIPPTRRDREVLLPVLAAASLYASNVSWERNALVLPSDHISQC